jgi:hypothetical protein
MTKAVNKGGRPSIFCDELADAIADRLIEGESLRAICRDPAMPSCGTVMRWVGENEKFREHYTRAREIQADVLFDEMLEIADDSSGDWVDKVNSKGEVIGKRVDNEAVQRSKLRLDTRKWHAAKTRPKKYGEKLSLDHSGEVKSNVDVDERQLARAVLQVFSENGNDEPDQGDEESEA